ncbi:three-Cys-motif partner protein TcmP [Pseudomonas syringae]|uniref:three-Cys-motif partner protein TcmP n=1 Tax=Pseudomonas syringae TaxID=317 RepID=UPI000CDB4F8E|nr:three-Cys-motif partner protein TcmP [Pseudomonas syringae]POR70414.1 hypothetical protein BKM27_11330 [Pseudomonas syringae pv. syringae]POR79652.1 hypothetical protein BKM30_08110 [Pseudomonas syringae pv. syringae]
MAKKKYDWEEGAILEEHSRKKHQILRDYFYQYVITRCKHPQVRKFRLAVVDGFSGAGRYKCGTAGSPIIFVEELNRALTDINTYRAVNNLPLVNIECSLFLNDAERMAIDILERVLNPIILHRSISNSRLKIQARYSTELFEHVYPRIKAQIKSEKYPNIIFNLDQCGHSHVDTATLIDMMNLNESVEVFYTFVISSLLAFLKQHDPKTLSSQLAYLQLSSRDFEILEEMQSKTAWLGVAENIVFENFKKCAKFVSPFSINNPNGWRYWLIHLANSYRARQVYNDRLHQNSETQAHFGRSGLGMLAHDPNEGKTLYLFNESARDQAKDQLREDIPKFLYDSVPALSVREFFERIYNNTPAHSDDINAALLSSNEIEIQTATGGTRRKANQIHTTDIIAFKKQRSFFFPK